MVCDYLGKRLVSVGDVGETETCWSVPTVAFSSVSIPLRTVQTGSSTVDGDGWQNEGMRHHVGVIESVGQL